MLAAAQPEGFGSHGPRHAFQPDLFAARSDVVSRLLAHPTAFFCAGIAESAGSGDPADVWRRSGCPALPYALVPAAAVQLVAAMALAGQHWFADGRRAVDNPPHEVTPHKTQEFLQTQPPDTSELRGDAESLFSAAGTR